MSAGEFASDTVAAVRHRHLAVQLRHRVVREAEVHLADLNDFDAMDTAYREFFSPKAYPARTTTESPKLFGGSKVEVTVQARLRDTP